MNTNASGTPSDLDRLRLERGADGLRAGFHKLATHDREKAVWALNDERLGFPSLFILIPEIEALGLRKALSPRNETAIQLCSKKENGAGAFIHPDRLPPQDRQTVCRALRWMLETGMDWDGPRADYDRYDEAIDTAAALLIRTCQDKEVLPKVCRLMFRRNRRGLLIHDLVWSFLNACDPDVLGLVAQYLLSDRPQDVELARKILAVRPARPGMEDRRTLYRRYMAWLKENKPYLRYTGEHFLQTSEPVPFDVDHEARYLGKAISPKGGKPLHPMTGEEEACLARFRSRSEKDRAILSEYSAKMHSRDINLWKAWMRKPISEQLAAAKIGLGVRE